MSIPDVVSKKRRFVNDGVFQAELNEFLARTLAEDGYAGVEVRVTPIKTEIIIRATRSQQVVGTKSVRINQLTSLVQKRFGFALNSVMLFVEKVANRGLCAMAQAESLRYKLLKGLPVRRACFGVLRHIMENGAEGAEVIVSGKLRAQRAKSMKFRDGYILSTGDPVREYVDTATRCVLMRQGMLGLKVKIMLSYNPDAAKTAKQDNGVYKGPLKPLPDAVVVFEPKPETKQGDTLPASAYESTMYQAPEANVPEMAAVATGGFDKE